MKKFLTNFFIFSAITIAIVMLFHIFLNNTKKRTMILSQNTTILFVGNSTVEEAIDDKMIPNSINLARYGEPISMTYVKIESLIELNSQIDTIIMSYDDTILFKDEISYPDLNFIYFISQFDISDWFNNLKYLPLSKSAYSLTHLYDIGSLYMIIKNCNGNPNLKDFGIGGFRELHRNMLTEDIKKRKKNKRELKNLYNWSEYQKYYMDKIIELCNKNNIKLIFLSTPKHEEVWDQQAYKEIYNKYYSKIPLLDYTKISIPDTCLADCYHLNFEGSQYFTPILRSSLNKN